MLTLPVVIESDSGRSDVVDRVIKMLATLARVADSQSSSVADDTAAPAFHPIDAA
jgi:hypothetical protein